MNHEEWEAQYQRRQEVRRVWQTPIILSWLGILTAWYFLVYHFCRDTFNPYDFNPKVHQVITEDGDIIDDASAIADEDGYVYASKWRDPRTGRIFTPTHPDVIHGDHAERIARSIVTFLCGLPLVYVYRLRAKAWGADKAEMDGLALNGILICVLCGIVSYFIPIVELAWLAISRHEDRI